MRPGPRAAAPDPFPYGWRHVTRSKPGGGTEMVQVPLTLEDVLHPKEGDVIPETRQHLTDRTYLTIVCESRLPGLAATAVVNSDLLTDFDLSDVRAVSPDVAVFTDLDEQPEP